MPAAIPGSSFTQSVYEDLRIKLLNGSFRPGDKLKISELCDVLSANLSAVREALSRLTSEGLVVAEPQRGFRAAPITADDLKSLTEARIIVEAHCLERAIKLGGISWETGIVAALHTLLRTPRSEAVIERWAEVHNEFHRALVAACDNPWLIKMREILTLQGERYRWLSVTTANKKRDLDKEHTKLSEAVLARDTVLATQLMRSHLLLTSKILLGASFIDEHQDGRSTSSEKSKTSQKLRKTVVSRASSRR